MTFKEICDIFGLNHLPLNGGNHNADTKEDDQSHRALDSTNRHRRHRYHAIPDVADGSNHQSRQVAYCFWLRTTAPRCYIGALLVNYFSKTHSFGFLSSRSPKKTGWRIF